MPAPGLIDDLRAWLVGHHVFTALIVDPGKTCGVALLEVKTGRDGQRTHYGAWKVALDDLAGDVLDYLDVDERGGVDAVICEDYSLQQRHNDPKVPSAQGIGVCRAACAQHYTPLFLLQPNTKTEGRRALDQAGLDARARCRSDHERDVIDLAGKVLKELRKVQR